MEAVNVLRMNAGDDISSYASNSTLQKSAILKSQKLLEQTVKDYATNGFPECLKLVDLGCSSGPNTLLVVRNIVNIVCEVCQKKDTRPPEFQVFLNDLPDNDFNTIFKMIPYFYSKLENEEGDKSGNCFISGVPGSFYSRLFPSKSIHFVHSSYSLHWLSQVPEQLENNKGNIYMSKASPVGVYEAYYNQYRQDFLSFLRLRSEEVIPSGRMVLTFVGRSIVDPTSKDCCRKWELLAESLKDVSAEGLLDDEKIDSFNLPVYTPCVDEVKTIVENEGSWSLERLETYEVEWFESVFDLNSSGKNLAKTVRAIVEPMLANHFGTENCLMDKLFERYAMRVADHLSKENTKVFNIVISMTRKSY